MLKKFKLNKSTFFGFIYLLLCGATVFIVVKKVGSENRQTIIEQKYLLKKGPLPLIISDLIKEIQPVEKTIYFIDTKDLFFFKNNIVIRVRTSPEGADTVVKLRPGPRNVKELELFDLNKATLEIDQVSQNTVTSLEVKRNFKESKAVKYLKKDKLKKLINHNQELYLEKILGQNFRQHYQQVRAFGPILSLSFRIKGKLESDMMAVEKWTLPNGEYRYELSSTGPNQKGPSLFKDMIKALGNDSFVSESKTEWALKSNLTN